ncbi:lysophospholipid acyltransferase family protein [Motilibacter deserti]|uniref:lysophospholipid acyltransferase family protein n=1 Tax=Motilibacter deserti TaxID=2714956 RepID=UPI0038B2CB74
MRSLADYVAYDPRYSSSARHRRRPPQVAGRGPVVRLIASLIILGVKTRFRLKWSGELPASAFIAVSRHDSYWDGVVACVLDPRIMPVVSRFWRRVPFVGWFLRSYGAIWTKDQAVANAIDAVFAGRCPWIAPFGFERRTPRSSPSPGAVQIARGADCPLLVIQMKRIPATPRRLLGRPELHVTASEPFRLSADEPLRTLTIRLDVLRGDVSANDGLFDY